MTSQPITTQAPTVTVAGRRRLWGILRAQPGGMLGAAILIAFAVVAVAAPWIAPDNVRQASGAVYAAPNAHHWLGTNDGGIDVFSLLLYGGRISLLVGFAAAVVATIPGTLVGVLSGYFGGALDTVLMRFTDFLLVIPVVPMMIVISAVWGASLFHLIIVIGVLLWTTSARVLRAQVKGLRNRVFVERALAIGSGHTRVLVRHILPQVTPLIIANAVLTLALAIFYETALAFLGLGDPTEVSWGTMIQDAFLRNAISDGAWWAIVPPGVCVAVVVIGAFLVGQSIEDALNPRLRVSHLAIRPWALRPLVGKGPDAL